MIQLSRILLASVMAVSLSLAIAGAIGAETDEASAEPQHGGTMYNGHEYLLVTESITWEEARIYCENQSGHLVTITDADENEFVQSLLSYNAIWIGLNDTLVEGEFVWVTGEEYNYSHWDHDEPNNFGNEDYGEMTYTGMWNDLPSYSSRYFIVEWEPVIGEEPEEEADEESGGVCGSIVFLLPVGLLAMGAATYLGKRY